MKRSFPILFLASILALVVVGLAGCGNQLGTVEGVVTDAATGQIVPNARVVVYLLEKIEDVGNLDAYTKGPILQKQFVDENGAYSFSLEKGSYILQVWIEGLEVKDHKVDIKAGRTVTVDLAVTIPSP